MEFLALALLGSVSGVVAGLAGLGGGTVIVPAITWLYGSASLQQAIVVSWFAVLFNSAGAVLAHYRLRSADERVDYLQTSKYFLLGVLLVVPVAALLMSSGKGLVDARVVGVLQLTLAAALLWPRIEACQPRVVSRFLDAGAGALIGAVSTLIGIGGGAYTTAYMVYGPRRSLRDAIAAGNMTAASVGALSVAGFACSLALAGGVGEGAAAAAPQALSTGGMVVLVASGSVASMLGVHWSRRIATRSLKRFLVAFLALSAVHLLMS